MPRFEEKDIPPRTSIRGFTPFSMELPPEKVVGRWEVRSKEIKIPREYDFSPSADERFRGLLPLAVDELMHAEEIEDRFHVSGVYRDLDLAQTQKLVFTGPIPAGDQEALRPRVDIDSASVIIPYTREDPVRDICYGLVQVLQQPEKPFTMHLNRIGKEMWTPEVLGEAAMQAVEDVGGWKDYRPKNHSGGRSPKIGTPIIRFGGTFQDMKLKGVGGKVLQPTDKIHLLESVGDERKPAATADFDVDNEGRIVPVPYLNPERGITLPKVEREDAGGLEYHEAGLAGELVIGHCGYDDCKLGGKDTGFAMTLLPKNAQGVWDAFIDVVDEELEKYLDADRKDPISSRIRLDRFFRNQGILMRTGHNRRLIHGYPSTGNVLIVDGEYKYKDFHQSKNVAGVPKNKFLAFCLHDMCAQIRDTALHIQQLPEHYIEFLDQIQFRPHESFLKGYFSDRLLDHRIKKVTPESSERAFEDAIKIPAHEGGSNIVGILYDSVHGHQVKIGKDGSYPVRYIPMVYPDEPLSVADIVDMMRGDPRRSNASIEQAKAGYPEIGICYSTTSEGRIERDRESGTCLIYLPKGADRKAAGEWIDKNLKTKEEIQQAAKRIRQRKLKEAKKKKRKKKR